MDGSRWGGSKKLLMTEYRNFQSMSQLSAVLSRRRINPCTQSVEASFVEAGIDLCPKRFKLAAQEMSGCQQYKCRLDVFMQHGHLLPHALCRKQSDSPVISPKILFIVASIMMPPLRGFIRM